MSLDPPTISRESALWAYRLGCTSNKGARCPFRPDTAQAHYWTMGFDGKPWRGMA